MFPKSPGPPVPPPLKVSIDRDGDRVVVTLAGEFDLASLASARAAIGEAASDGFTEVVVDMRGLSYIDSCGIALLLKAIREDEGSRLRFIPSEAAAVRRVLQIAGVDEALGGGAQPS